MATRIEIDFTEATQVSKDILAEAKDLQSRMSTLNNKIVNNLTAVWKGDAADKFTNHYRDNMQQVLTKTAPEALDELSQALAKNIDNFQKADAAGAGA